MVGLGICTKNAMMKTHFCFGLLLLIVTACGQSGSGSAEYAAESKQYDAAQAAEPDEQASGPAVPRQVIRRARLEIETGNLERTSRQLKGLLAFHTVAIDAEEHNRYGQRLQTRYVLRVSPEAFDTLVLQLGQLGDLREKSISADDVTRQYVDLEARLSAKRAAEQRYRELMSQAENVQEVLSVEAELRKLIEELEATEAQLRSLKDQVQRSTIELVLFQPLARPVEGPTSFARRLGRAFSGGWALLQDLFVGLISLWPVWILLAGLWFGWRSYRRLRS